MNTRLILLGVYFLFTPVFLFILVFYLLFLSHQNSTVSTRTATVFSNNVSYRAIPDVPIVSDASLAVREARVDVLNDFFSKYNSPLVAYAGDIVDAADRYGLDYRLLPAIAMQESILCKRIPKNSFNCWGFGIYGGKITRFTSFSEAIETISKTLSEKYHKLGLQNPEEIMSKYTPANTNDWAGNVSYVMDRIGASL